MQALRRSYRLAGGFGCAPLPPPNTMRALTPTRHTTQNAHRPLAGGAWRGEVGLGSESADELERAANGRGRRRGRASARSGSGSASGSASSSGYASESDSSSDSSSGGEDSDYDASGDTGGATPAKAGARVKPEAPGRGGVKPERGGRAGASASASPEVRAPRGRRRAAPAARGGGSAAGRGAGGGGGGGDDGGDSSSSMDVDASELPSDSLAAGGGRLAGELAGELADLRGMRGGSHTPSGARGAGASAGLRVGPGRPHPFHAGPAAMLDRRSAWRRRRPDARGPSVGAHLVVKPRPPAARPAAPRSRRPHPAPAPAAARDAAAPGGRAGAAAQPAGRPHRPHGRRDGGGGAHGAQGAQPPLAKGRAGPGPAGPPRWQTAAATPALPARQRSHPARCADRSPAPSQNPKPTLNARPARACWCARARPRWSTSSAWRAWRSTWPTWRRSRRAPGEGGERRRRRPGPAPHGAAHAPRSTWRWGRIGALAPWLPSRRSRTL
jgi:hypothetical protein